MPNPDTSSRTLMQLSSILLLLPSCIFTDPASSLGLDLSSLSFYNFLSEITLMAVLTFHPLLTFPLI